MNKQSFGLTIIIAAVAILVIFGSRFYVSVPAGHVAVATFFGEVQKEPYPEGLHVPVNPFYNWTQFDVRQKTHLERANVPSQDQLQTQVDVSVQFRVNGGMTPEILQNTGTFNQIVSVQLVPKLRSLLREQGKSVIRAEDFFNETTQNRLQVSLLQGLSEFLEPKGVEVSAVLIRDINLPPYITQAIQRKKEREQEAEREKAELERVRTQLQQKVARAEAERAAAEESAQTRRTLADAQAYEITKLNEAIEGKPAYIQLQALEALKAISKDDAAKIYFIDSKSQNPLPLMHLGDGMRK